MTQFDVYAYGVIAASTLHLLQHPFPAADGYAEISATHPMTGGEALNTSIVLRRLGLRVRLDGNWLGDTAAGRGLLETIKQYGIDARRLKIKKGYAGVAEIIFSDEQSRTIFGNYVALLSGARMWNVPRKKDVARAQIVSVDPPFAAESAAVGQYAAALGIPFVAIDCPYDQALATDAAAVIISGEFRRFTYAAAEPEALFREYQARAQGLVVFTFGGDAVWYGRRGEGRRQFAPYRVPVVDTTGAGDSFRAGVLVGLMKTWADDAIIRYASALAALVCASFPGVLNSPTHQEVVDLIAGQAKRNRP